jgi:serine/threonine protein kinase
MLDERQWRRVTGLFDQLLSGEHLTMVLESESDAEIRAALCDLWEHHLRAGEQEYLETPLQFEVAPTLAVGQTLLGRFRIERSLGAGGMGEVYLAWDERLEDWVALKTIARLLTGSEAVRRAFATEVLSARRVTHPNVCRIHDLFDEGELMFFSMEHVDGVPLSSLAGKTAHSRAIATQIAKGLHAAHQHGVVHGDIKPANILVLEGAAGAAPRVVIMDFGLARALDRTAHPTSPQLSLRGGTAEYMAPELLSGGAPTVRSDIFAFGQVAQQLEPGNRLWRACLRPQADNRPASLAPILRKLETNVSRRAWIGGSIVSVAGATAWYIVRSTNTLAVIPSGSRFLVNGFSSQNAEASARMPAAQVLRGMLLTALEQSPRIRAISDQDVASALKSLAPGSNLPVQGNVLGKLVTQLRASLWVGGEMRQDGGRYSLSARLMTAPAAVIVAAQSWHDAASIVTLAQDVAHWVRKTVGESPQSMAANPVEVGSYTSEVPEALEKYYAGVECYAAAEMDQALPLFEEAVRLDAKFAQAYSMLGLVANALRRYDRGYEAAESAVRLAEKLPIRERTWIALNYAGSAEDPNAIELARRNLSFQPDEPRALGTLGQVELMAGRFDDAATHFREAARLAPSDWMPALLLEDTLIEAGKPQEAIREFQSATGRGITNPWLSNAAGVAYVALEQYDAAVNSFWNEPRDAMNARDVQSARIMNGELVTAIAAMRELRARAQNPAEHHQAVEYLCGLYFVTDNLAQARASVGELAELPPYPLMARRLAGAASWARRLEDDATLERIGTLARKIATRWANPLTASVAVHVEGLRAWRRKSGDAEALLLEASGKAYGVWAVFDLAEFYTRSARWDEAEEYWKQFEKRRGTLLVKGWFPGTMVVGWLYRAAVAQAKGDRAGASQYSKKLLDHWGAVNPTLRLVREAANIHAFSTPPL